MTDPNGRSVLDRGYDLFESLSLRQAFIICALFYVSITGIGLMIEGHNFDDWRHMHGASDLWAGPEGRWSMDFLFRYIMMERFHLPLQILLAFPCLWACSYGLAQYVRGPSADPLATIFIFLIGTNHIYMSSALMFNAHLFAYPFAFLLSFLAFHLAFITRHKSGMITRVGLVLVSAQLLSFSLGIYQTFALFGLAIPVLVVLRHDRFKLREEWPFILNCLIICLVGLLLYGVEWQLYVATLEPVDEFVRFFAPTLDDLIAKVAHLPEFLVRTYAGALVPSSMMYRIVNAIAVVATAGVIGLSFVAALTDKAEPSTNARLFSALRIVVASVTLVVILPILFWFTYKEIYTPGRVVAAIGFWIPALLISALTLVRQASNIPAKKVVSVGVSAIFILLCAATVLTASETWSDRARIHHTDKNVAHAIYARVNSMEGHDGRTFRIVGGLDYSGFSRGGQIGWTTLHPMNQRMGIFKAMFNLDDFVASFSISPKSCEAMPSAAASYVYEGIAYVCLEPKTAFLPLTRCTDFNRDGVESLCIKDNVIIHKTTDCSARTAASRRIEVLFLAPDDQILQYTRFQPNNPGLALSDGCYSAIEAPLQPYEAIEVRVYTPDAGYKWNERIDLGMFDGEPGGD